MCSPLLIPLKWCVFTFGHMSDFKDFTSVPIYRRQRQTSTPPMSTMLQSQEYMCLDASYTSSIVVLQLEELSLFFREQRVRPLPKEAPAQCPPSSLKDQREQAGLFNSTIEPERLLRSSDSTSSAPRPRRFYRTFWRGITKRALAQQTRRDIEMK